MRQAERARGELASLGMGREEVDLVSRRGRDLSRRVAGVTTPVFTSAAYDIRSGISGLDAAGVADFTELAALTAAATKADLLATGYGAFKGSLFEAETDQEFGEAFAAQLAKAVEQFKTDGSKMQQAIQSMGSGLAGFGVSLGQQFAALGLLQQKMTASEAGTTLSGLERTAAQAQERFAEVGVDVWTLDARGNMLAPSQLLREMQAAFGHDYTTEVGARIQEAFGFDEAVRFFKGLWGQQGALEEAAAAQAAVAAEGKELVRAMQERAHGNMDARLELLQQRWNAFSEIVFDGYLPKDTKQLPTAPGADASPKLATVPPWVPKNEQSDYTSATHLSRFKLRRNHLESITCRTRAQNPTLPFPQVTDSKGLQAGQ